MNKQSGFLGLAGGQVLCRWVCIQRTGCSNWDSIVSPLRRRCCWLHRAPIAGGTSDPLA